MDHKEDMNENDFLSKITALSSKEINDHPAELLWLIQSSLETKGPYKQDDLIQLIEMHSNELAECIACDLSHKRWKPFFDHKMFNKRDKNKVSPVIKSEEKDSNRYFVLVSGEKKGPYSQKDVEHFLDTGDLKLNDLLSADQGKSWRKIYHFPLFDRRKDQAQATQVIGIESLDNSQLEKSRIFTTEMLQSLEDMPTSHSAIEGALIARRRHLSEKNKKYVRDNTQLSAVSETVMADFQAEKKRSYLVPALTACLLFIAVGMSIMPGSDKKTASKTKKTKTKVASKDVENIRVKDVEVKPKRRRRASSSPRKRVSMRSRVSNSDIEVPTEPLFVPPPEEEVRFPQPKPRTRRRRRMPSVANNPGIVDDEFNELEDEDPDYNAADGINPGFDEGEEGEFGRALATEGEEFLDIRELDPDGFPPEDDPLDEFE